MTREENLHWIDQEIRTWESECQSKHPIKEALYAARKALEQEPCEDAVSRKSVITIIQNHWWNCRDIDKLVNDLPSVTPQEPRWIPVTERLPKEGTFVLASYTSDEGEDVIMTYYNKYGFTRGLMNAWMPLPQPYRTGGEDKE